MSFGVKSFRVNGYRLGVCRLLFSRCFHHPYTRRNGGFMAAQGWFLRGLLQSEFSGETVATGSLPTPLPS